MSDVCCVADGLRILDINKPAIMRFSINASIFKRNTNHVTAIQILGICMAPKYARVVRVTAMKQL